MDKFWASFASAIMSIALAAEVPVAAVLPMLVYIVIIYHYIIVYSLKQNIQYRLCSIELVVK